MPTTPRSERNTQDRVVELFKKTLGYRHLGKWEKWENRCIEEELFTENLKSRGYSQSQISAALQKLQAAADTTGITLYEANRRVYSLLRYGIPVQTAAGQNHETVHLIDWEHPEKNEFAIAEEVTIKGNGGLARRPDLVIYLNGIAVAVIELKRGAVEVAHGIRQLISNQEDIFNKGFFSTVQLLLAGNDSQGLRYGTVTTSEKFFVEWKVATTSDTAGSHLDLPLAEMCEKSRLLDWIHNFIIFDGGIKKVPRQHQLQGVKAAQESIRRREGGVIWHTQGSGKSIVMVLLAKWLLETDSSARMLIVTDRDELDKQIEGIMRNAGVVGDGFALPRVTTRAEFEEKLTTPNPRLLCALIHKFDPKDLAGEPPRVHGNFFVFVDECHRTQNGDMHKQMKRWLPGAIFIGFTGTPLLRQDKETTGKVFGGFIHTYKFHEAVRDGVVLDLTYEARDIEPRLTAQEAVDEWFEQATNGLNNYQKAKLRSLWANMEKLMSSKERKERIVADIIRDFAIKPRLNNDRGTAILVSSSIYDACHYYRIFQDTPFGKFVGIITSYEPNATSIATDPANTDERFQYDTYTQSVLKNGQTPKAYEDEMKRRFIKEPANCKLLIVVEKLLTGFDAPSCTYIYLDSAIRDHTLFQAICRTNRLDGDDKPVGHIVDYKALFNELQNSIAVYTSDELDLEKCGPDANIHIQSWLTLARKKLDDAREAAHLVCEPVAPPCEMEQYLRYFCGADIGNPEALTATEPRRIAYYKVTATLLRAYAALASNLVEAGYSQAEISAITDEVNFHTNTREEIKVCSAEELDTKPFEGDMRHLINSYIQAEHPHSQGNLDNHTLTDLIVTTGIHDALVKKFQNRGTQKSVAEGIINNLRKTIIRNSLTDPRYYEEMSKLLDELIRQAKAAALDYEKFLKNAEDLAKKIVNKAEGNYPQQIANHPVAIVLFRNLPDISSETFQCPNGETARATLALALDAAMLHKAPANWRGDPVKEAEVYNALYPLLNNDRTTTEAIFQIVTAQNAYP